MNNRVSPFDGYLPGSPLEGIKNPFLHDSGDVMDELHTLALHLRIQKFRQFCQRKEGPPKPPSGPIQFFGTPPDLDEQLDFWEDYFRHDDENGGWE